MLPQDAVVVNVPAGAVEEVQVVRNFDEPHARLDQPPGEQAAAGRIRRRMRRAGCRLLVELENPLELRPGKAERFADRGVVLLDERIAVLARDIAFADLGQQRLAAGLALGA